MERRQTKQRLNDQTIDCVREFFVDPKNPATAEDLAEIGGDAIRVMAQIYSTGGCVASMGEDFRRWLEGGVDSLTPLKIVSGKILKMEADTRRFDERFMGQIHPQGNKIGILANLIAAYMNNNLIVNDVSQAERKMEEASIRWLADIFGYDPDKAGGNILTGGTEANETALTVAREKLLDSLGLENPLKRVRHPVQMYALASTWRHYSVDKNCDKLGIGLLTMPSDNFKIDLGATERAVRTLKARGKYVVAIVGLAGETETGSVEDLQGLAEIAAENEIYYHVDAAYGGPYVLSRAGRLFEGIQSADSITVDPHKMLYTPYSAGAIIFKNARDQDRLHTNTRYLGEVAPTPSGSRGSAGAISTYATIELMGREGIATLLNHTLDLADAAYEWVSESEILRPIHAPELNTMLIGLTDKAKETAAKKGLVGERYDEMICAVKSELDDRRRRNPYISNNSGVDKGRGVFRFIGVHPYTTCDDVVGTLQRVEDIIKEKIF